MTVSEEDIIRDQQERNGLQKAVADAETALADSAPGARRLVQNFIDNAKTRIVVLDKKIKDEVQAHEVEMHEQIAVASLAERESALNTQEKETYSGFLKENFFARKNFGKLDEFYRHTWDRLSQGGKDEMSHRVWEGVRHKEYKFSDLPESVKTKEETQAYRWLSGSPMGSKNAADIPESDRTEFLKAYEAGDHRREDRILDRPTFKENMFLHTTSTAIKHAAVTQDQPADSAANIARDASGASENRPDQPAPKDSVASLDLSTIDLSGIKVAAHPEEGAVANLARDQSGRIRQS